MLNKNFQTSLSMVFQETISDFLAIFPMSSYANNTTCSFTGRMLWHAVILALLVASGSSDTAEKGNLDDLIDDVFGSPARSQNIPNEKPCNNGNGECVPYYLVRIFFIFR